MKNIKIFLAIIIVVFSFSSCRSADSNEPVNMEELMKIRIWMLDKNLEGKGRWGYTEDIDNGNGYWIPDDGVTEVANEDVFVYEALEVGVPRTTAPMTCHMRREGKKAIGYANFVFDVDYDGLIKVEKIEPKDSSLQLRYALGGRAVKADCFTIQGPSDIEVSPIGRVVPGEEESDSYYVARDTVAGKEYTIQIQACSQAGDPVVTATIKLTTISDPEYPWQTVNEGKYDKYAEYGEERTRFCTVELLSYTYSEMYILGGAIGKID